MLRKFVLFTLLTLIWLIVSVSALEGCLPNATNATIDAGGLYAGSFGLMFDDNTATYAQGGGNIRWKFMYDKVYTVTGYKIYITGVETAPRFGPYDKYSNSSYTAVTMNGKNAWSNIVTWPEPYIGSTFFGGDGWSQMGEVCLIGSETGGSSEFVVRMLNTDIFTNQTINPSNFNVSYNDGISNVWYNETGTDGDIETTETSWIEQTIRVCSAGPEYPQICNNIYIPNTSSVIIWQKLVPLTSPFPTPTIIPNVSTNITSKNFTEPLVLPKFTLINKSEFRNQITNNSIIGNYTYGITSFMDELGDAVNQTVQDSIEFIDVPFDFLIDIQAAAHNLYLALFIPLIPFTYLPLIVTSKVVAVIPWQIQSLISMGLLVDLFYLMIRGSGGS